MATSVEDLCNAALRRVKYPTPIGSIWEGSRASRIALDYYSQTRDNLLNDRDWDFARQSVSLGAAVKTAPAGGYGATTWDPALYPPLPWQYEYAYPSNCILVRAVRPTPVTLPERNVLPNIFVVGNDTSSGLKVVLTNLASAMAIISAKITDPSKWQDAGFEEALIDALAVVFEKQFSTEQNPIQLAERDAQQMVASADVRRG